MESAALQRTYNVGVDKCTSVDFSKILGGKTKILREKVVKSDKCMDVSQLLGEHVPGLPPQTYAYGQK